MPRALARSALSTIWMLGVGFACACGGAAFAAAFVVGPRHAEAPANAQLVQRVILIGDAGDPRPGREPAMLALAERANLAPDRTVVLFLGDNIYETGMPEKSEIDGTLTDQVLDEALLVLYESRRDAERRIDAQLDAATAGGARAYFIPGNHDWNAFAAGSWQRLAALEAYVLEAAARAKVRASILPAHGCPGPTALDLPGGLRVVAFDSQWWLEATRTGHSPTRDNPAGCRFDSPREVLHAIVAESVEAHRLGREVVIADHHPILSVGPHGGYAPLLTHLFPLRMTAGYLPTPLHWFPLPVLGSAIVGMRAWSSPTLQDMSHPTYRRMIRRFGEAMDEVEHQSGRRPLLFAAGHDHSLQLFEGVGGPRFEVVSGLGSSHKASGVGRDSGLVFADSGSDRPGFFELDALSDGSLHLAVQQWSESAGRAVESYSRVLVQATRTPASPAPVPSPAP